MNNRLIYPALFGFAIALLGANPVAAQNNTFDRSALKIKDSVDLKSGSTLFGFVKSEGTDDDGRKYILFETDDGGLLKLDVGRMVQRNKIHTIDEIDKEYNQFISSLADVPDAHWELLKWCESQPSGKVRFKDQIKFHLERIMKLDPNDDNAKRQLGYDYIREQDRWVPEERYYQSIGYERSGTSWAPMLQRDLDRRFDQMGATEGERKLAFRIWTKEARKANANPAVLRTELFKFCDVTAVPFIFEAATEEPDPRLRAMYVEAIGRVDAQVALNALCVFAIREEVDDIRERALTLLSQDHFNRRSSVAVFSQFLSHELRPYVLRAAFAIGELGDETATLALCTALVSKHMVQPGGQAGRIQTGVGGDGNINGLQLGGNTAPVMRSFQNQDVVNALRKVTKQNFGFDEAAWTNWYIKNNTHYDIKARR